MVCKYKYKIPNAKQWLKWLQPKSLRWVLGTFWAFQALSSISVCCLSSVNSDLYKGGSAGLCYHEENESFRSRGEERRGEERRREERRGEERRGEERRRGEDRRGERA